MKQMLISTKPIVNLWFISLMCLTLIGCDVSPLSDEALNEYYDENKKELVTLKERACKFTEDPEFSRLYLYSNDQEFIVTGKNPGYQDTFELNASYHAMVEELKKAVTSLELKELIIIQNDNEKAHNSSCSLRLALTHFGMPSEKLISGIEYNPQHKNLYEAPEESPARTEKANSVSYSYKIETDSDEPWYLFFEKT